MKNLQTNEVSLRDQYRERMNRFAHQTAIMSLVQAKHPDYQALLVMGEPIIPFLLEDIQAQNPDGSWSETQEEYWSSFWGAISLLWVIADNAPILPEKDRGMLRPIRKLWIDWGIEEGYLVPPPTMYLKIKRTLLKLFIKGLENV